MPPPAVATEQLLSTLSSHLQLAPRALLQVVSMHVRTDGHTRRVLPAKQVDGVANSGDSVAGPRLQEGRKLDLGYLCRRLLKRAQVGLAPRDGRRRQRQQSHPCPDGPIGGRLSSVGSFVLPKCCDRRLKQPTEDGRKAPDSPEARRRHRAAAPTSSCMCQSYGLAGTAWAHSTSGAAHAEEMRPWGRSKRLHAFVSGLRGFYTKHPPAAEAPKRPLVAERLAPSFISPLPRPSST